MTRRAVLAGVVGGYLLVFTGVAASASTSPDWGSGVDALLPANAGAHQSVSLDSISCPSVGNCTAVGSYLDDSGNTQGLLMTESAGTWKAGVEAALPADAADNPIAYLDQVSCSSAGNCGAVGGYAGSSGLPQVLLMSETNGVWATGVKKALPAKARAGFLVALSCASAGICSAVGSYLSRSRSMRPVVMSEKAGRWRPGLEAKLPGNASTKQRLVELESVSCPSPGSCTAVGGFFDKTGNSESLLLSESASRWRTALKATLPSNATATHKFSDDSAFLLAVSCASAGHCSAVGNYCAIGRCNRIGGSGGAGQQGLLLTETRGRWARGVEAKLPGNAAGAGPLLYLNSISCASAGNCSATGSYFESPQKTHLVLLTEKAARWTRGIDPALPADAATGAAQDDLGVNSISCSSPGNCTAAGTYSGIGSDNTRPMLLTETTGEWSRGVEVALPRNASTPYQYSWLTVSCTSSQNCSGVGFYTDSSNFQQGLLLSNATPAPLGKRR